MKIFQLLARLYWVAWQEACFAYGEEENDDT